MVNIYLYRFTNKNNEIIYICKTTGKSIKTRLYSHFSTCGHLSGECYLEVNKVEYANINSESDLVVYEPYYINTYKPKYNSDLKREDNLTIELPKLKWIEIKFNLINNTNINLLENKILILENYLNELTDIKILEEEQETLKQILTEEIFRIDRSLLQGIKKMHPNTFNSIMTDVLKLPYRATAIKTSHRINGKPKKYTYWTITKTS